MPKSIPLSCCLRSLTVLTLAGLSPLLAGEGVTQSAKSPVTLAESAGLDDNPLSFLGGQLVLDSQFNSRLEVRDNTTDFNSAINAPNDAAWLLTRFRLGALYHATDWLHLYAQGQDIRELGGSRPNNVGSFGADGDDNFDALQAWAWIGNQKSGPSLQIGRQPFNYGDQRLLGNPQWLNSTRAWDAVRFHYFGDDWNLDLFSGSPVTFTNNRWNQSDIFNDHQTRDAVDSGAYFTSKGLIPWQSTTEFYVLNYLANKAPGTGGMPLGGAGHSNIWTVGTLMKGDPSKLNQWDYDFEMAAQFGKAAGLDHRAFAGHWGGGYNFDHGWKPRLGVQYNYASGDRSRTDGRNTSFQNYFPGNHALYGFMDTTAWINVQNPQVNFRLQPTENLKLTLDYNLYWNATNNDAWYGANTSSIIRPPSRTASSKFRGQEVDLNAYYKMGAHLALQTGYSVYFAGDYLAQTGASDNAQFGYLQVTLNF